MNNENNETKPDSAIITYKFIVNVISGFLKGKEYQGCFSYNSSQLSNTGEETIEVVDARFRYQGVDYTESSFDWLPQVSFKAGEFQHFIAVGGSRKRRFGINAGFIRLQFDRPEEAFIKEGKDYFGYLDPDPDTFVEGAGKITYMKQSEPSITPKAISTESTRNENVLASEVGVDYSQLHNFLKAGQWKEADSETGRVILQAVDQVERGWLTDDDIENFPSLDLRTIDQLWLHYSKGRFGLSVQKCIWQEVGEDYLELGDRLGWRLGDNWLSYDDLEFSNQAPRGHLPFAGIREEHEEYWTNQFPFVLPLIISRSPPMQGRLKRSGAEILNGFLLRTLLEQTDL